MASDLKTELTDRFVKGIRRSFTPCPLIGPKWLQAYPNGKPADFRFFGVRKLAKAIGRPPAAIVKILMRNVNLKGLDVDVDIKQGVLIDINRRNKPAEPPASGQAGRGKPPRGKARKPQQRPAPAAPRPEQAEHVSAGTNSSTPDESWSQA